MHQKKLAQTEIDLKKAKDDMDHMKELADNFIKSVILIEDARIDNLKGLVADSNEKCKKANEMLAQLEEGNVSKYHGLALLKKTLMLNLIHAHDWNSAKIANEDYKKNLEIVRDITGIYNDKSDFIRYNIDKAKILLGSASDNNTFREAEYEIALAIECASNVPVRIMEAQLYQIFIKAIYALHLVNKEREDKMQEAVFVIDKLLNSALEMSKHWDVVKRGIKCFRQLFNIFSYEYQLSVFFSELCRFYKSTKGEHYWDTKFFELCNEKWKQGKNKETSKTPSVPVMFSQNSQALESAKKGMIRYIEPQYNESNFASEVDKTNKWYNVKVLNMK
jgi:hypothetical protein